VTAKSENNPRIGIFGGTFNPIHTCHLKVAAHCRKALGLDRIRFIPAATPPLKADDLAPAADRFAMVQQAIASDPCFEISDVELRRDGPSYTRDTLSALQQEEPTVDWTLILGLDAILGIDAWHQPDAVLRQAPIAVLFRDGADFTNLASVAHLKGVDFFPLTAPYGKQPITVRGDGIRLILLPIPPCNHSATAIRAAIRSGTVPVPGLSPEVATYIIEHHLYV
jgi:nicotinate-nucleotide adenylyltransferase